MAARAKPRRRTKPSEVSEEKFPTAYSTEFLPVITDHWSTCEEKRFYESWITFLLDSEDDETTRVRIFPRYGIFFLMALVFYSRHLFLSGFEGLGMLHPDETFQAIEVAHSEVYGYGFSPHENYAGSEDLTSRDEEDSLHMPPPSWLYPRMYVLLFRAREYFGWEATPFEVARRFHGFVAASLPFFVYKFARTVFGQSRDIAFTSASLVAFSKHIMLLGIHPFLQSFISPILFFATTVILEILGIERRCGADTPPKMAATELGTAGKLGLFTCGTILGLLFYFQIESVPMILLTLVAFLAPPRSGTLPRLRTLVGTVWLLCGAAMGLILGAAQDLSTHGHWFWTPSRAVRLLIGTFRSGPAPLNPWKYVRSFLGGSHVHIALVVAALAVSLIYVLHSRRFCRWFDGWVDDGDELLFRSTCRMTLLAVLAFAFRSLQSAQDVRILHDAVVLLLTAGSAAAYLLYSSLYAYILTLTRPGKTTRNMVKLILYAELFLYMFEARMTFPTAQNRSVADWAFGRQWESAYVNRCVKFVGQQHDVTGVLIDFDVRMSGGYALLHRDVPIYAKSGLEFREWGLEGRRPFSRSPGLAAENVDGEAKISTSDGGATDFVSLLNLQLLVKRIIEKRHYNYVIVSGERKFFKKGFREVYNASNARVFKRSKSRTESEHLYQMAEKIPVGTNATVLEYEGSRLVALGNYEEASKRLKAALEVGGDGVETWKLLIIALKGLNRGDDDVREVLAKCKTLHGSTCEQDLDYDMDKLRNNLLEDLKACSETYKFIA